LWSAYPFAQIEFLWHTLVQQRDVKSMKYFPRKELESSPVGKAELPSGCIEFASSPGCAGYADSS
jgi:hypothetical protein